MLIALCSAFVAGGTACMSIADIKTFEILKKIIKPRQRRKQFIVYKIIKKGQTLRVRV